MNIYTRRHTCKGKIENNCAMWDAYKEKCPFFTEEPWEQKDTGEKWTTFDCAPIRTMYATIETRERVFALQQANEEQRNRTTIALGTMLEVADRISKTPVIAHAAVELLERKDEK